MEKPGPTQVSLHAVRTPGSLRGKLGCWPKKEIPVEDIRSVMERYSKAFSGDPKITAEFFDAPACVVAPGMFRVMETKQDIEAFIEGVLARIRPLGYASTTCEYVSVKMLNPVIALASVVGIRRRADGSEMESAALTYLLTDNNGWKIRQLIATDFDKLL
jgi:hypothetical protein